MFDLKVINSVLGELEEERGIPRASVVDAIGTALATAYKKEYGRRGQVIRAKFDIETGDQSSQTRCRTSCNGRNPELSQRSRHDGDGILWIAYLFCVSVFDQQNL